VKRDKVDFVPRIPILMHFAADAVGVSYGQFAGDYRVMFEANKKLLLEYGFEQLDILSDPFRETSAFGGKITWQDTTIPRCTHPLAETKNLDSLPHPDPERSERLKCALNCIDEYKIFGWRNYSITGWVEGPAAEAAVLRGPQTFLIDLIDDETFVGELMDLALRIGIDYATAQVRHGCDTVGIGDAIASQISPDLYERLVVPREKKLIEAIHAAGALARLHICGNINHLLGGIAQIGADIVDCDWMVDMKNARRILGPRVTLTGNLDPVSAVMTSTPAKIRRDLLAVYEQVGNPWFVNAGCEIPRGTPAENLRALCEPIEARY
jgi:MtaA/CmuA family methyltransferase